MNELLRRPTLHVHFSYGRAHLDRVAFRDQHLGQRTGERRRHLH